MILGAPGSGKSTFVQYLALCLAGAGIDGWTRDAGITSLDCWSHGALTPVYVELRRFVASEHFPDIKTPATADHLWAYICAEVLGADLSAYAEDLRYDLEHGHAVLILDGLDEVPYPEGKLKDRQNQLIGLAQSLNTRYATSRIIVASRPYAYKGWALPGFQAVEITAFEDKHRLGLAQRLYAVAGLGADTAGEKAWALNGQLERIDDELKDRPLFVTLMATIYLQGQSEGLPTRRGALYRESILLLLDRWTTGKPDAPSLVELLGDKSPDDLYDRLAALAYEVHNTYGDQPGTPEINEGLLYTHLRPLGRHVVADLIPYLSENAGVLVSPGQDAEKDVFRFAHRTFQEYLAASHLVKQCLSADSFQQVREHITVKPQVWRVPCTLAGDVLADTDRRGDLWDLLHDVLEDEVEEGLTADDPRWWAVWLASVVLTEQKLLEDQKLRRSERAVCDLLRDWLVALVETPFALALVDRVEMGRILSELGDPRPGVGVVEVKVPRPKGEGFRVRALPDIDWVHIPAGEFTYQDGKLTLDYDYHIARYPVTYAQFQTFLDDPEGYRNTYYWFEGLAANDDDKQMEDQYFKYGNHPRENVNWYQAVAFCRWLSWRYEEAGLFSPLPEGEGQGVRAEIRLPTEFEWEKAARANTGWVYPYGNDFDAAKGNTSATGIRQTSAVGIFPTGDMPHWSKPISDLSGNVWEWCLTDYKSPQVDATKEDIGSNALRVLRGGSFLYNQHHAAASSRYYFDPDYDYRSFGVRLVLSAPMRL